MKTFEIGKTYETRSIGDHNCVWSFTVKARTAQTVTFDGPDGVKKCRINKQYTEWRGAETIFPLGRYSMCPVLDANDLIA